jgi:hypothetical protein
VEREAIASTAGPVEPTELGEWLAPERDLLDDVRLSLEARYPLGSDHEKEEEEGEEAPEPGTPLLRGIQTALAAFVPTFVVVFLGLPYLLPQAPAPLSRDEPWAVASPELRETWMNDALALALRREDLEPKPVRSVAGDTAPWVRAAAFADDGAADRLAASMRSQGYRVDVRREDSATLPWVVWVTKSSSPRSSN